MGTVVLMMKTQIGLGVLSIPTAFDTLGMVPGIICLCAVAFITTWSDYIVGIFKLQHPSVYGIDDAGGLILGRPGRFILSAAFCLCMYPLKTKRCNPLTLCRLDIRYRIRYTRHFDRLKRSLNPRCMHICLCCSRCYPRLRFCQCANAWPYYLACVDWTSMHSHSK